jgi:DNA-directed RNA polymerase subunit A'
MESEFDSEEEKERFLGTSEPPTNLSEHAGPGLNKAGEQGVESDD